MPIPSALPWMKVQIYSRNDEKEWENVLWFTADEPLPGGFNAKVNAGAAFAHFQGAFANPLQIGFASVEGARVSVNNTVYTTVNDVIESTAGNEASAEIPSEMAVIVQAQCEVAGPSGKGRAFLHGVCANNVSVSRLSTDGLALYGAVVTALNGNITTGGVTWKSCIYSRHNNSLQRVKFWELSDVLCHRKRMRPRF